jgi:hypothetical protein
MFIYPIFYYHNWRNISTIYIYITRLASKEIFSPSNKIHREVGRAKDLSAPRWVTVCLSNDSNNSSMNNNNNDDDDDNNNNNNNNTETDNIEGLDEDRKSY